MVHTNPSWNLKPDDGKIHGSSFKLDVDEFAIITAHRLSDCDAIYIVETTIDPNAGLECGDATRRLANDGCNLLVIRTPYNRVEVAGYGVFRVQRVVEDGITQSQGASVSVTVHKAKPVSRLQSRGFCDGC